MKIKNILLLVCCFVSHIAYGQSDKVVYILPDSVEMAIKDRMEKIRREDAVASFSCMLFRDKDGTYGISLFVNEKKSESDFVGSLLKKSTRVVLIDKEKLPLILDYDLKFSSPNLERIGEFGKREGHVRRSTLLFHGYTLLFNAEGKITNVSLN